MIKKILKQSFAKLGYEISPITSRGLGYISASTILGKSKEKNISVNEYMEELWGLNSHAKMIVERLNLLQLQTSTYNVIEIGAGTGIYIDKVFKALGKENITSYQVYETAADWMAYLKSTYPVKLANANGYLLNESDNNSADLIHAHGVFVYTPFITTASYFNEMIRVAKPGAIIAFDLFDETCFSSEIIQAWIDKGHTYPNIVPENIVLNTFTSSGCTLINNFYFGFSPGKARYFVFRKNPE